MFCKNCGQQMPDGVMFCPNCGEQHNPPETTGANDFFNPESSVNDEISSRIDEISFELITSNELIELIKL